MAMHFLLTRGSRDLPLANVLRMHEDTAYEYFCRARWPETGGKPPYCLRCGSTKEPWAVRRRKFKCREPECRKEFSVTSGTIFANHKLSFRTMLALVSMSANSVKGKAALQVSRELGVEYKTAWHNLMKLREALAAERAEILLREAVDIDGMYVGGHVRPRNERDERVDRRRAENRNPNRRCILGLRQRNGRIVTVITTTEYAEAVMAAVRRYVDPRARIAADEHRAYNDLGMRHPEVVRVNHQQAYQNADGEHTNLIESFFSRVRRSEIGIHHKIASTYLDWYAAELAWREDHRRVSNGAQVERMLTLAMTHPVSEWLNKYKQGNHPERDTFLFEPGRPPRNQRRPR